MRQAKNVLKPIAPAKRKIGGRKKAQADRLTAVYSSSNTVLPAFHGRTRTTKLKTLSANPSQMLKRSLVEDKKQTFIGDTEVTKHAYLRSQLEKKLSRLGNGE